ncbi:Os07g0421200 [Oryza sativa Japonica Group]|uniref:Os07g0421200 protein n=1 Tax=Oryza sativa subsp. japonica TaxID=39947 RepID=C7J4H5_ORYSJ|nr:Os07g0421200 [Oryza sativa Japonica Group]|eukprot:NP_001175165.1 Os07g0421200 [Oryza sativa Japonica Group]
MPSHIYFCCSHGKKRERRESILRREFDMVLRIINKSIPAENHLRFLHWDLHENSLENL